MPPSRRPGPCWPSLGAVSASLFICLLVIYLPAACRRLAHSVAGPRQPTSPSVPAFSLHPFEPQTPMPQAPIPQVLMGSVSFVETIKLPTPQTLEQEKQRSLSGRGTQHKDSDKTPHAHAPGWNEPLASASEAAVKADQAHGTPQDLQKRTVEGRHSRGTDEGKPAKEDSEWTRGRQ
ncbi:hypothetical protein DFH06DRAFT_1316511 [Mycena polygramma]|nr:hypothetical protein DFH06DRAFT_1316511 [Mycena polygramma]